jgi:hypothetical protein
MSNRIRRNERTLQAGAEGELPLPWQRIQGAIWLVGLGFLIWKGWIFPGIFVLLAISGLFQAGVMFYLKNQEKQKAQAAQIDQLAREREDWLPSVCPTCGAPINMNVVQWTGPHSGSCPYCSASLKSVN